ncbi:MAG: acyltransferase [Rhodocyclaceae bacterium]|nr:acyltransferase [Rhodocyclaceae bacterium]MDZ4216488.1 acyltransferase [Rhodocyclaceae bacterium]
MQPTHSIKGFLATAVRPLASLGGGGESRLRQFWSFARLAARFPELDPSVVVLGHPELHGTRRIAFGRDLYLYRDLYLETRGEGHIAIGDGVVLSRGVHLVAFESIEIGAGCMIGEYASLRDANHRFGPGLAPRHAGHETLPIRVGCNVWIGRGVTVLPGVSIGDGAVIGANAVVTRDVAPGTVVAGVPARPLHAEGKS